MSFKKQHSIHVSTLRTIIISEADWNASGKIFITRRMMKNAESKNYLPPEHLGGRKGKKSTDGGLTKRLILDNARMQCRPMAVISTDAANCYDRMIHKIIALAAMNWGVPNQVIKPLLAPLHKAKHYTRTAYGDSTNYFTGDNLQGAGQGNTGAAPFWTMVSTHMISVMKDMKLQSEFLSPLTKKKILLSLIAFVDDTELFLTDPTNNLDILVKKANQAINTWRSLLQVTGGAMRPDKCAWTLMRFDPNRNRSTYDISIPDSNNHQIPIHQYSEKEPRQYLGIIQRTDGSEDDQIKALLNTIEQWNNRMISSRLFPSQNLKATLSKVSRSILYPLPALTLTEAKCIMISNKLYSACLPKCGISSKFPIAYRYLPERYQGLGLPDMYFEQEASKLNEFVFKSNSESICWQQLKLGLEIAQNMIGSYDIIFNSNYTHLNHLLPHTWIKSLWKFMFDQRLSVRGWGTQISPKREHDPPIMNTFVQKGVTKTTLSILNKCRKYINAICLSDICTGDGLRIAELSIKCEKRLQHPPTVFNEKSKKPTVREIQIWKQFIRACFCVGSNTNKLCKPLGKWNESTFDSFTWYYNKLNNSLLKKLSTTTYRKYVPDTNHRTSKRNNKVWYKIDSIVTLNLSSTAEIWAATVQEIKHLSALFDGAAPFTSCPDPISEPNTLYHQLLKDETPKWIYKYVPKTYLTHSLPFINSIISENLQIASDGSYKTESMGAATILETTSQNKRIILPMPVPNNNDNHHKSDSYRAEAVGVLAAFHIIRAMVRMSGKSTHVTLACDNDRVLEVAQTYTYVTSRMRHHDVLRSIMEIRDSLHSTITFQKVKAHKSDNIPYSKLSRIEQLNTECDELAKLARTALPAPPNEENIFQGEGISIWDDQGAKLTSNLHESLRSHYFHNKAQTIMKKKYGWNKVQFNSIDWKAQHMAQQSLSPSTQLWISKLVTKFLPIGRNMLRRQHWREDYCPRCRVCVESHDHLLTCNHQQCIDTFRSSLEKIETWMSTQLTPLALITDILHVLTNWKQGVPIAPDMLITPPFREQLKLGDRHFIEGRLVKDFSEYMDAHYKSIDSKKNGKRWTSTFIQKIWTVLHKPQWENRNSFVHKLNEEASKTRVRENLQHELTTLYLSNLKENLLHTDQRLYEPSLTELLQKPNAHISAWIEEIRVALAARDQVFLPTQQKQAAYMHNWLRQSTRTSPRIRRRRKRRVSSKPRRQITLLHQRQYKRKRCHPKPPSTPPKKIKNAVNTLQ